MSVWYFFFFFQAEDGIRDVAVTGVQTCALPICRPRPAAYSAGRLVVHVRDDTGSEFSARSGADPQSKSVTLGAGPLPPPNRQEGKMNARKDIKRPSDQSLDARPVLAAAQLRFAARV